MTSLRGRLFYLVVKYYVGAQYRKAGNSIEKMRAMNEKFIPNTSGLKGIDIQPVQAGGVPAEWLRAPGSGEGRTLLYLHGGAFVMGSPAYHRDQNYYLAGVSQSRVLALDYRLAPEHPFPAAIEDTLAAYRWLMENGTPPQRIVFGGDSAGGGLAVQAMLALRDAGEPQPAGAFLLSPYTDYVYFDGESYQTRAQVDPYITLEMSRFTGPMLIGDHDPAEPLLSPVRADLRGLPPLCIHVGDREVLLSDSTRLAQRAAEVGIPVELKVWPDMWHEFMVTPRFVPEGMQSIREIGQFILSATP